jgi:hypothetical protein
MGKGSKSQLMFDLEASYGVEEAAVTGYLLPFNPPLGLKSIRTLTPPQTIRNNRNAVEPIPGNLNVSGAATIPVDAINFGYWLTLLLGIPPVESGASPSYLHEWIVPESGFQSAVMEVGFTDIAQYFKYSGVKINSLGMEIGGDGELVASVDLIGANRTQGTSPMDAAPTTEVFERFGNFQATLKEGGSTLANAKKVSFTLGNNLDEDGFVIGGLGIRGTLPEGMMAVSGSITALFDDMTLLDKALNSTESSLEITLTNDTNILVFSFPELKFEETAPAVESPGSVVTTLNWFGFYDNNADASSLKISLTNDKDTYDIHP